MELFRQFNLDSEPLLKQFRLQVNTELEALREVLQWFEEKIKLLLPESYYWQCQLALTEGFTNAVRYAHKDLPPTTPIDLEVNVFPDYLEMRIWDWGQPFDLQAQLNSLRESSSNPLEKESNRGLLLIRKFTDYLQYIRLADGRNCLIMYKNMPAI